MLTSKRLVSESFARYCWLPNQNAHLQRIAISLLAVHVHALFEEILKFNELTDLIFANDELATFLKFCCAPGTKAEITSVALGFGRIITSHGEVSINYWKYKKPRAFYSLFFFYIISSQQVIHSDSSERWIIGNKPGEILFENNLGFFFIKFVLNNIIIASLSSQNIHHSTNWATVTGNKSTTITLDG